MQLSVIIVNYNVRYFLEQCLCSVLQAAKGLEAEVIVVDNASADGSVAYLQPLFPQVKFVQHTTNAGFAKANNQGLEMAGGEFILFLNPDTILPADIFRQTIAYLQQHPQRGALGVKMLDGSGVYLKESKRGFPSPLTSFFKLSGITAAFPKSKLLARYYLGHLDENKNQDVDVLAGAFMLLPRKVLEQVGGFDERFFMYGEDIDLSYRIQQAGFINCYFTETPIIHFKGESTQREKPRYTRLFYKAMQQFVEKHYSGTRAFFFRIFINMAIWLRALIAIPLNLFRAGAASETAPFKKTLVIGSVADQQRIREILQQNNYGNMPVTLLPSIQEITTTGNAVILCSDEKGFGNAIMLAQQVPAGNSIFFHATGSNSMAGSRRHDANGMVLALK